MGARVAPRSGHVSNLVRHERRGSAGDSARLSGRAGSHGVLPKPLIEFIKPHSACLVKVHQERKRVEVVELQPVAVDSQERRRHGHRDAFVSIHERMVLREALPQNRRLRWDIGSLSETLQKLRMFCDEIVGGLEERRLRAGGSVAPFQVVDKLPHRILLLRRQRPDHVG